MKRKILSILLIIFMLSASLITIPVSAKILNDGDDSWVWAYSDVWTEPEIGGTASYATLDDYLNAHYVNYTNLEKSEITTLYLKHLDRYTIQDLSGIYDFTNLQQLVIENPNEETCAALKDLDLNRLSTLEKLSLTDVDFITSKFDLSALNNLTYLEIYNYNTYSTVKEYATGICLEALTKLTHFSYSISVDPENFEIKGRNELIALNIAGGMKAPDGFDFCYSFNEEAQIGLEIVFSLIEDVGLTVETDKYMYGLSEEVIFTVKWNEVMEAVGLSVLFEEEYLELVGSTIEDHFYYIEPSNQGVISVNWAALNGNGVSEMSFIFKPIGIPETEGNWTVLSAQAEYFATGDLDTGYETGWSKSTTAHIDSDYVVDSSGLSVWTLNYWGDVLSGFELVNNKLTVQSLIDSDVFYDGVTVVAYDKHDQEITDAGYGLGSGAYVRLFDEGELVKEFRVMVYGDTNGDGEITPLDALVVIQAKNQKISISDFCSEAGKVFSRDTEGLPNAIDALAIIKHLNGKYEIQQTY